MNAYKHLNPSTGFAEKPSPDLGCSKDTSDRTPGINPLDAHTAESPLPIGETFKVLCISYMLHTGPIYERTCKPIPHSRTTSANAATSPLPSRAT